MGSVIQDRKPWQDVVAEKRRLQAELLAHFATEDGNQKSKNDDKLRSECYEPVEGSKLVARLASGEVSCESLVKSYIKNLTEICFEEALEHAKSLDDHLTKQQGQIGPLHGIPVTLKDQFDVKGYDTTIGYVGRALSPAKDDAALVKMLRSLGAVIMAKTNLPQSIMWCETENPLFGLTTNPFSPDYTPGGSTGGEAALISRSASVLGFGTDIGGSIRIPSHMMGIYGLKPSSSRLPYHGVPVSTDGQEHVPSSVGPMASSLDTIHLTMKSLINLKPWDFDARCSPIPWREEAYNEVLSRPLVIGVLFDDGVARPHPPVTRVLQEAVQSLKSAGHEIVEWNPDLHAECIQVLDEFYTADGGEDIRTAVTAGGEPFIPHVEALINRGKPISIYEYWQINRRKWDLQQAYLEKWNSIRTSDGRMVDAILMPPMPHTAVPHKGCKWVGYTKVWNVLDYSTLVVPGGNVCEEDVSASWVFESRGALDDWSLKLWKDNKDDMASMKLPVGVQLVGRKLEEEKLLGMGKILDDILRASRG
ncbi:Acetamidase [Cytospora mali]|uniref:Acetamidase n=1 Tax=Cytospora mali TaxID=578113 RepID=A0A194V7W1_CYTMA|nr:Acetamidase [Valsa mali var. pyri (nom. inval.)]